MHAVIEKMNEMLAKRGVTRCAGMQKHVPSVRLLTQVRILKTDLQIHCQFKKIWNRKKQTSGCLLWSAKTCLRLAQNSE